MAYLVGFVVSFISFSMQIFIPKIGHFFFSEITLSFVFTAIVTGFSVGCFSGFIRRKFPYIYLVPITILTFIGATKFFAIPEVFYLSIVLFFIPLGAVIMQGLLQNSTRKFYFFELFGGGCGLVYGTLILPYFPIESSLALYLLATSVLLLLQLRKRLLFLVVSLCLLSAWIFQEQVFSNSLNFLYWAYEIPNPPSDGHNMGNGFHTIKTGKGVLVSTKWSVLDRIDVIRSYDKQINIYANNKNHTGIVRSNKPFSGFDYLKSGNYESVLSVGLGGGREYVVAKHLGAQEFVGVEINRSVILSLKEEMPREIQNELFKNEIYEGDIRVYLKDSNRRFDLIFNRYTTHMTPSDRFFTRFNLARTTDTTEAILNSLTDKGKSIWVFSSQNNFVNDQLFTIIRSAARAFSKSTSGGQVSLKHHFVVMKEKQPSKPESDIAGKSRYNIIVSFKPMVEEEVSKYFLKETARFQRIFPSNSRMEDSVFKILAGLPERGNLEEIEAYLAEQNFLHDPTDNRPIVAVNFSSGVIERNAGVIGLLLIIVLGLFISPKSKVTMNKSTSVNLSFFVLAICTGFFFGYFQIALVQMAEYETPTSALPYGILLGVFMLGSGVGSLLSAKMSMGMSAALYMLLPVSFVFLKWSDLFANKYFLSPNFLTTLFLYIVLVSILFPKLMVFLKEVYSENIGPFYCSNILAMSLGVFTYCWIFVNFGKQNAENTGVQLAFVIVILVISIFLGIHSVLMGRKQTLIQVKDSK